MRNRFLGIALFAMLASAYATSAGAVTGYSANHALTRFIWRTQYLTAGTTYTIETRNIVRRRGAPHAFGVDAMLGQHEVVVRPLEDPLLRVPGLTGSTDLGDGHPVLVVDLFALSQRLVRAGAAS